jgi:hypothetical protein
MSARIPSVVEQDGKLSSAGTGAGGISRRTLRNDRSSGHAGRKGVVRRAAVGCQMTWDYTPAGRMQRIDHPMVQLGGFSSRCCRSCRSSVPQKEAGLAWWWSWWCLGWRRASSSGLAWDARPALAPGANGGAGHITPTRRHLINTTPQPRSHSHSPSPSVSI